MIYEKYIKEMPIFSKKDEEKDSELIKSIIQTREDLIIANKNFEYAEGELIDYFLYQIKASKAKYNYLLKKAKDEGILVTMVDEIEMKKENVC